MRFRGIVAASIAGIVVNIRVSAFGTGITIRTKRVRRKSVADVGSKTSWKFVKYSSITNASILLGHSSRSCKKG